MTGFILTLLKMSLTASVVIIFVLILRLLIKKAPKIFSYLLWGIVFFRLICPFAIESPLSFLRFPETGGFIAPSETVEFAPNNNIINTPSNSNQNITEDNNTTNEQTSDSTPSADKTTKPSVLMLSIAAFWAVGAAAMLIYGGKSLYSLKKRLASARVENPNERIYSADSLETAFVLGVFKPKIYIPSALSETEKSYIILHEKTHIARLDHIVKIIMYLTLCVHWFNPLVWLAFVLCSKDMEMSCDESVIKKAGMSIKADYSSSLLNLASGRRIIPGTPLAFSENGTKSRIKNILSYKKPALWVIIALTAVVIVAVVCFATNPASDDRDFGNGLDETTENTDITNDNDESDITSADDDSQYKTYSLTFPEPSSDSAVVPANIYNIDPFEVKLTVPAEYDILSGGNINGPLFTPYEIYKGDELIGAVGYNIYEPYDGEIDEENYYQTVYPELRLGSMQFMYDYSPVVSNDDFETAVAVWEYADPDEIDNYPGAMASVPHIVTDMIVSYSRIPNVYIGIIFEPDKASEEEIRAIAESVSFEISEPENPMLENASASWDEYLEEHDSEFQQKYAEGYYGIIAGSPIMDSATSEISATISMTKNEDDGSVYYVTDYVYNADSDVWEKGEDTVSDRFTVYSQNFREIMPKSEAYEAMAKRPGDVIYTLPQVFTGYERDADGKITDTKQYTAQFVMISENYPYGIPENKNNIQGQFAVQFIDENGEVVSETGILSSTMSEVGLHFDLSTVNFEEYFMFSKDNVLIFSAPIGEYGGKMHYLCSPYGIDIDSRIYKYIVDNTDKAMPSDIEIILTQDYDEESHSDSVYYLNDKGELNTAIDIEYVFDESEHTITYNILSENS